MENNIIIYELEIDWYQNISQVWILLRKNKSPSHEGHVEENIKLDQ